MTQEEFYLRTIIAMAGNPNYVDVSEIPKDNEDDDVLFAHILDKEEVLEDARELLRRVKQEWMEAFDKYGDTINDHLSDIADAVGSQMSVLVEEA